MIFNSIEFFIFLPVVFTIYWLLRNHLRWQNAFVITASYLFYGWWDWRFLILIAFTSVCSWCSGLLIERHRQNGRVAKCVSNVNIVANLLILGIFKYYNFFIVSFAAMFPALGTDGLLVDIILPVGISFYTFQALSYSIDVYREKIKATHDPIAFLAYVSFFPQLVAGPIERATNLLPQFEKRRTFDYDSAVDGIRQMLWGFFKKLVVADNCAIFVDEVWGNYAYESGSTLWLAAVLFAVQIYGDFSGYSDIAIGSSKLFGIRLMKNFDNPYFSRDIAEFWRRWHISLTTWFRDYIYIPLGGSRVAMWKVVRNTFVIFLVSGLWHGANWTFVAWGAYHAALFLPLIVLGKNRRYKGIIAEGRFFPSVKDLLQILLTFILVVFGWVLFRSETIGQAASYWSLMVSESLFSVPSLPLKVISFSVLMFVVEWIQRGRMHPFDLSGIKFHVVKYACYVGVLAFIFVFGAFRESFIYFQF